METAVSASLNGLSREVVDAAYTVHSRLGPGLLESVYETCLAYELSKRGIGVKRQLVVPVYYDDIRIDEGFRIDLLIEDSIVIEIKSVERSLPVYEAQLLTYLKMTGHRLGFLMNFNVSRFKDGVRRMVL
ncbi:GxxExxY protein [Azospirillum rugosum]|uniref:GxxExxY protein n=1 Tax=Azospirillum rugosum TaxID=416170 RepID=A0ABS4SS24_9PROT|nr:GxxExxY protein [Azospirillum rugosum]MBP2295359.1 GxxExxY protein [Azospirillum rugosum]MDQ0528734.1 GxxExxY protein [Azospirillum rugosum]